MRLEIGSDQMQQLKLPQGDELSPSGVSDNTSAFESSDDESVK